MTDRCSLGPQDVGTWPGDEPADVVRISPAGGRPPGAPLRGRTPVPPPISDWGRQDGTLNDDTELQVPSPPPRGTRGASGALASTVAAAPKLTRQQPSSPGDETLSR